MNEPSKHIVISTEGEQPCEFRSEPQIIVFCEKCEEPVGELLEGMFDAGQVGDVRTLFLKFKRQHEYYSRREWLLARRILNLFSRLCLKCEFKEYDKMTETDLVESTRSKDVH
jgi:hypothetical protein